MANDFSREDILKELQSRQQTPIQGGFSREQIMQEIQSRQQAEQPKQDLGFFGNYMQDREARQAQIDEALRAYQAGEQTRGEQILQSLGAGVGSLVDLQGRLMQETGQGLRSAGQFIEEKTPIDINTWVSQGAQAVARQPLAQRAAKLFGKGVEKYQEFAEENPRAARNIGAVGNIASVTVPALKRADDIISAIQRGGKAVATKIVPPKALSSEELRDIGGKLFKYADEVGGTLKSDVTNQFVDDISRILPQTEAAKTLVGDTPATKLLQRAQSLRDEPLTLQSAKEIDEILGELGYSTLTPQGTPTKEGMKFLKMQDAFRETIENADESLIEGGKGGYEALKTARDYWSTSLRLNDIEKIIQRGLNSEQPATSIKNGFKTLMNSKKFKMYSEAEQAAIKNAAQKGALTDLIGAFGSRLGPQITGAGVLIQTGDPLTAGVVAGTQLVGGALARGWATKRQLNRAQFVEDLIRQRVGKFGKQSFQITPEIKKLLNEAGIVSAPAGGVDAILNELEMIKELPSKEEQ